jgi:hypothetical protein
MTTTTWLQRLRKLSADYDANPTPSYFVIEASMALKHEIDKELNKNNPSSFDHVIHEQTPLEDKIDNIIDKADTAAIIGLGLFGRN